LPRSSLLPPLQPDSRRRAEIASALKHNRRVGSSINCLGRRVTSYTTRDAKEIAKLLVIQTSTDFLKYA
jgi:hypothetical protein